MLSAVMPARCGVRTTVGRREERMIGRQGLCGEDVERGPAEMAARQSLDQGRLVDDRARAPH